MDLSPGTPLTPQHPGLAEVLADAFNRSVWELLRRGGRAATVEELSRLAGAPPEKVSGSLDRLMSLGLVKAAFSSGTRRRDAFRIARERLVVVYDRRDAAQAEAARRMRATMAEHGRSVLGTARQHADLHDDAAIEVHRSMHLRREEFVELRRRMQSVTDYVESIESSAGDRPHLCNYHMALEVRPLKELVLPAAHLHVIEGGHGHHAAAGDPKQELSPTGRPRTKVLSSREREIARLLGDGRSCPEIAETLSVSVNTVRTITKRVYAKLGVRRRAELVNALRGPTV
jgi:DNA-binding CsgD family transcriptional regulator/DNA-binding Lrp family transcriptional regulator